MTATYIICLRERVCVCERERERERKASVARNVCRREEKLDG